MRKMLLVAVACGALLAATPANAFFGSLFGQSSSPFASLFVSPKPAPVFNFAPPSSSTNLFFGGGIVRNGVKFALTTWSRFTRRVGLR